MIHFIPQRKILDDFIIYFFKTNLLWIPIKKIEKKFYTMQGEKLLVHEATGVVNVDKVVTAIDAGKILSAKTAESRIIGGVVGGIGMA